MNILQFIASMTNALVWPAVVVTVAILLRKSISHTITSIERLRLDYKNKDLQIDFSKKFAELEKAAKQARIPEVPQALDVPPNLKVGIQTEEIDRLESLQKDLDKRLKELEARSTSEQANTKPELEAQKIEFDLQRISLEVEQQRLELQTLVDTLRTRESATTEDSIELVTKRGPVGSILIVWSELEKEIFSMLEPHSGAIPSTKYYNPKNLLERLQHVLENRGLAIDEETRKILLNMKLLRNQVANKGDETNISFAEALEYAQLAKRMIALLRSMKSKLSQPVNLVTLEPREFERLTFELLNKVISGDPLTSRNSLDINSSVKGPDAILYDALNREKTIVEVKRYKPQNPVSISQVRELFGTMHTENAKYGIMVTTSSFTQAAREFAMNKPILLIDGVALVKFFQAYGYNVQIEPKDKADEQQS